MSEKADCKEVGGGDKMPYKEPKLTVHGTVNELTKNVGPNSGDGMVGSVLE